MMAGEEGFVTPLAGAPRAYGSLGEAVGEIPSSAFQLTARFSVIDPHRMMQTYGLTDGFIRTGMITLSYGQVSVNATRCKTV